MKRPSDNSSAGIDKKIRKGFKTVLITASINPDTTITPNWLLKVMLFESKAEEIHRPKEQTNHLSKKLYPGFL
jgi:hypothetical protein